MNSERLDASAFNFDDSYLVAINGEGEARIARYGNQAETIADVM